MKKIICILFSVLLLCGCSSNAQPSTSSSTPLSSEPSVSNEVEKEEIPAEPSVEVAYETLQKYTDALDNTCATYLAELKNIGEIPAYISDVSIDVEDSSGQIFTTHDLGSAMPRIIMPGESAYICEDVLNSVFDGDITTDQIGNAILHYDVESSDPLEIPSVELSELSFKPNAIGSESLVGRVTNTGAEEIPCVRVCAVFRDENGTLQGFDFKDVDDIPAGETFGFEMMFLTGDPNIDLASCQFTTFVYRP